jgi:hypothetical protein
MQHVGCLQVVKPIEFARPEDASRYRRTINGLLNSAQEMAQQSQSVYVAQ